jgi:hypothetical protein
MPHFTEIAISETGSDYIDLEKIYRVRAYRKPPEAGGTVVEIYFMGMATPVVLAREPGDAFLRRFVKWAGS